MQMEQPCLSKRWIAKRVKWIHKIILPLFGFISNHHCCNLFLKNNFFPTPLIIFGSIYFSSFVALINSILFSAKSTRNEKKLCSSMKIIHKIDNFLFTIFPKIDNYIVGSFPNKRFSGYQLLAYYFVSWKLAIPEHAGELGLEYQSEYDLALKLVTSWIPLK